MDTRRDFVYVDDLVSVVIKAVDGTGSITYHVSSGSDISIKEMFDATTSALNMGTIDVEVRPRLEDDAPSILLEPVKNQSNI